MSSSPKASRSGTSNCDAVAVATLRDLANDIEAGRKTAIRVAIEDDAHYSLAVETVFAGAPTAEEASDGRPQCPKCGAVDVRDIGKGDAFCLSCQATFTPSP